MEERRTKLSAQLLEAFQTARDLQREDGDALGNQVMQSLLGLANGYDGTLAHAMREKMGVQGSSGTRFGTMAPAFISGGKKKRPAAAEVSSSDDQTQDPSPAIVESNLTPGMIALVKVFDDAGSLDAFEKGHSLTELKELAAAADVPLGGSTTKASISKKIEKAVQDEKVQDNRN